MASQLRVDQILPTIGVNIGIGTAGGNIVVGGASTDVVVNGSAHITGNVQGGTASFTNISAGVNNGFHVDGGAPASSLMVNNLGNTVVGSGHSLYLTNGNLVFSTSGTGIDFSATADATGKTSELLDDYEEGTWTPTSETGTIDYTSAKYTKIGNIVHLNVYIDGWSNITSDAVVQIQSLPYAGENTDANVGSVMYRYINDTDGIGGDLALFMANGNSLRFYFQNSVGDSNYAALKHKDINGDTSSFRIQMTYRAA